MDVKGNYEMITDIQSQHQLLRTALEATDNYLFMEKRAVEAGEASMSMIHEFTYEVARAQDALEALGVLDKHQPYILTHIATMAKLQNLPGAYTQTSGYGGVEESILVSFAKFINEETDDPTFSDEDISEMVEALSWEDIIDLYPEEDLIEDDEEDDPIDESLSAQARLKKRQSFARVKSKRFTAKRIKLRRASTPAILQKRAQLAARRIIYQRFLRGRDKSAMSASEKDRIEKQVKNMKGIQSSIATRMVPKMRSIEQKRLAHYRSSGKK